MSKSTAFRVLGALVRNGFVERLGSKYRLGWRLYELGTLIFTPEVRRIRDVLTPFLADLYELTHETVHLATLHGPEVLYVARLFGHRPAPSPSRVGGRTAAHCTALGKVMLAYHTNSADLVLQAPLRAFTAHTITDAAHLRRELDDIRQHGIAFNRQEMLVDLNCVAVPLFGPGGRMVAALSVSGATNRFTPDTYAEALRRVSHAAGLALRRTGTGETGPSAGDMSGSPLADAPCRQR